ncbi:MAG: hypothetical protein V3V22_02295, partial [Methylococcales bacterium]
LSKRMDGIFRTFTFFPDYPGIIFGRPGYCKKSQYSELGGHGFICDRIIFATSHLEQFIRRFPKGSKLS